MKLQMRIALVTGALALSASPTALAAGKPEGVPPESHGAPNGQGPTYTPDNPTPGPKAGLPAKAKAYGRHCKGENRKHVKGEKGTAFSRCVTNMAQAANHGHMAPGRVCKEESRKHVKGEKGTAFSRCVRDVAHLRREERREERQQRREEREAEQQEGS
jgi:hypothetical protein